MVQKATKQGGSASEGRSALSGTKGGAGQLAPGQPGAPAGGPRGCEPAAGRQDYHEGIARPQTHAAAQLLESLHVGMTGSLTAVRRLPSEPSSYQGSE